MTSARTSGGRCAASAADSSSIRIMLRALTGGLARVIHADESRMSTTIEVTTTALLLGLCPERLASLEFHRLPVCMVGFGRYGRGSLPRASTWPAIAAVVCSLRSASGTLHGASGRPPL
jgi:hypothetical protein